MKSIFAVIILLILLVPGIAFALDFPTSVPTAPPTTPPTPPPLPEETPEIPDLPEDLNEVIEMIEGFDFDGLGFGFEDIIPVFAYYETLPAERDFAPDSFDAVFYSAFSGLGADAALSFYNNQTLDFSYSYSGSDPLGNTWSHTMEMSLRYDKQAFLSGSDTFLSGSFLIVSSFQGFNASIGGSVASQYICFEDAAPLEELENKTLIMLTQHIESIQGWPSVDIDDLVCFLDPESAFCAPVIEAAAQVIEQTDEQQIAREAASSASEYSQQIEEAVETAAQEAGYPLPANAIQVAIGGSITALLMAVSGIAANIGSAGGACAAGLAGQAAGNAAQQAAGISAAAQSAAAQAASAAGSGIAGATGVIGAIKSFFTELFVNLRNMITDEGRSFASGKVSEILKKGKDE